MKLETVIDKHYDTLAEIALMDAMIRDLRKPARQTHWMRHTAFTLEADREKALERAERYKARAERMIKAGGGI